MAILMTTPSIFRALKEHKRIVREKGGKSGTYNYVYIRNFGKTYGVMLGAIKPKSVRRVSYLYDLKSNNYVRKKKK